MYGIYYFLWGGKNNIAVGIQTDVCLIILLTTAEREEICSKGTYILLKLYKRRNNFLHKGIFGHPSTRTGLWLYCANIDRLVLYCSGKKSVPPLLPALKLSFGVSYQFVPSANQGFQSSYWILCQ